MLTRANEILKTLEKKVKNKKKKQEEKEYEKTSIRTVRYVQL